MKILIIEDERPLAEDLRKAILSVQPDAVITAIIPSVEEGIEYLMQPHETDLIFSDIQLGDGLSFDIFKQIENKVPVVFCTAFNHYMLEAFDTMGIDYILKPFSRDAVVKAIQKFKLLTQPQAIPDFSRLINSLAANMPPITMPSVIIHQGEKIIPISGNDIALFYIRNDSVLAYTFDKKQWPVNQKLEILEKKFIPFFYRANRQFLVNRKAVKSASQHFHRKIQVLLNIDFSDTIIVGKERVTDFLDWLSRY